MKDQLAENDQLMQRFAEEIRQMDIEIDRKQREQEQLDRRNQMLQQDVDMYREKEIKYNQVRISLDEEQQRRVYADTESDRLRNALSDLQCSSSHEIENLKRAVDELRMQNEENLQTIHHRNIDLSEISRMNNELKQAMGQTDTENEDLQAQIIAVEKKNRMLNDKINEIIYNKATNYKNKTLDAL